MMSTYLQRICPLKNLLFSPITSSSSASTSTVFPVSLGSVGLRSSHSVLSPTSITNHRTRCGQMFVISPSHGSMGDRLRCYSNESKYKPNPSHQQQYQQYKQSQGMSNSSSNQEIPTYTWLQPDKNVMRYVDELIDFREKPRRTWLTVIKVLIVMFAGVNFGAYLAKTGATLLEKYEIFVRGEDDSDD